MQKTTNTLPEKVRYQIVGAIQERLAESIDLTIQAKHAHWNVKGPHFSALHILFDQIAEQSEAYSDAIAERIVQLGGVAEGTLQATFKRSKLPEYPIRSVYGDDHITALAHSLSEYGGLVRVSIAHAQELADAVTADIFTEISRDVDKNLWLVEAHSRSEH